MYDFRFCLPTWYSKRFFFEWLIVCFEIVLVSSTASINRPVFDCSGMPSSFRGSHGKIVYKLTATLTRSWKLDRTTAQELNFVSRSIPNLQYYMVSQMFEHLHGTISVFLCDVTVRTRHRRCRVTRCLGIIYLLRVYSNP